MEPGPVNELVSNLTSALIGNGRERGERSRSGYPPWEEDIPGPGELADITEISGASFSALRSLVPDVEATVDRFARQDGLLHDFGLPAPSVLTQYGPVPIDLGLNSFFEIGPTVLQQVIFSFLQRPQAPRPQSLRIVPVPPEVAEDGFRQQLQQFLKVRLYSDHRIQNRTESGNGYMFEVTTNSPHLRIHYSPAYFINPNLAFGAPTSPVRGRLQPGRYVFGAYLPDPGFWSSTEYDVPGPVHCAHIDI